MNHGFVRLLRPAERRYGVHEVPPASAKLDERFIPMHQAALIRLLVEQGGFVVVGRFP